MIKLIWKTQNKEVVFPNEISCEILDRNCLPIGEKKFYSVANDNYLANWISRPAPNATEIIPLKNAISPATRTTDLRCKFWSNDAVGYMRVNSNDMQQANDTSLFSSGYSGGHGYYVNAENISVLSVVFAVRKVLVHTWMNDIDQFLQPNAELSEEFKNDCLIYMLFNGSNLTASANGLEWNGQKWNLVNHFIPFTEMDVNAKDSFSSHFMSDYICGSLSKDSTKPQKQDLFMAAESLILPGYNIPLVFSIEAQNVMDSGRELWRYYHQQEDSIPDASFYDIRLYFQGTKVSKSGKVQMNPISTDPRYNELLTDLKKKQKILASKIEAKVYEYGFLKK